MFVKVYFTFTVLLFRSVQPQYDDDFKEEFEPPHSNADPHYFSINDQKIDKVIEKYNLMHMMGINTKRGSSQNESIPDYWLQNEATESQVGNSKKTVINMSIDRKDMIDTPENTNLTELNPRERLDQPYETETKDNTAEDLISPNGGTEFYARTSTESNQNDTSNSLLRPEYHVFHYENTESYNSERSTTLGSSLLPTQNNLINSQKPKKFINNTYYNLPTYIKPENIKYHPSQSNEIDLINKTFNNSSTISINKTTSQKPKNLIKYHPPFLILQNDYTKYHPPQSNRIKVNPTFYNSTNSLTVMTPKYTTSDSKLNDYQNITPSISESPANITEYITSKVLENKINQNTLAETIPTEKPEYIRHFDFASADSTPEKIKSIPVYIPYERLDNTKGVTSESTKHSNFRPFCATCQKQVDNFYDEHVREELKLQNEFFEAQNFVEEVKKKVDQPLSTEQKAINEDNIFFNSTSNISISDMDYNNKKTRYSNFETSTENTNYLSTDSSEKYNDHARKPVSGNRKQNKNYDDYYLDEKDNNYFIPTTEKPDESKYSARADVTSKSYGHHDHNYEKLKTESYQLMNRHNTETSEIQGITKHHGSPEISEEYEYVDERHHIHSTTSESSKPRKYSSLAAKRHKSSKHYDSKVLKSKTVSKINKQKHTTTVKSKIDNHYTGLSDWSDTTYYNVIVSESPKTHEYVATDENKPERYIKIAHISKLSETRTRESPNHKKVFLHTTSESTNRKKLAFFESTDDNDEYSAYYDVIKVKKTDLKTPDRSNEDNIQIHNNDSPKMSKQISNSSKKPISSKYDISTSDRSKNKKHFTARKPERNKYYDQHRTEPNLQSTTSFELESNRKFDPASAVQELIRIYQSKYYDTTTTSEIPITNIYHDSDEKDINYTIPNFIKKNKNHSTPKEPDPLHHNSSKHSTVTEAKGYNIDIEALKENNDKSSPDDEKTSLIIYKRYKVNQDPVQRNRIKGTSPECDDKIKNDEGEEENLLEKLIDSNLEEHSQKHSKGIYNMMRKHDQIATVLDGLGKEITRKTVGKDVQILDPLVVLPQPHKVDVRVPHAYINPPDKKVHASSEATTEKAKEPVTYEAEKHISVPKKVYFNLEKPYFEGEIKKEAPINNKKNKKVIFA
ncbi:uncharacterized protein trp isoform X4 [Plodia interpunctella]|uniref:uncharacterized protein trp isoform X4 n=1 Tax=Plodia interpunctella TaxID=58824 RepID=UPI00236794C7|nr:uncharacterized protein LOC128678699 isoform X4 [Plodia interpunctella]